MLFLSLQLTVYRWFGHNSKQQKLERRLVDMRLGMRLKVSSDKADFRLWYVPHLFPHIVKPLVVEGRVSLLVALLSYPLLKSF